MAKKMQKSNQKHEREREVLLGALKASGAGEDGQDFSTKWYGQSRDVRKHYVKRGGEKDTLSKSLC